MTSADSCVGGGISGRPAGASVLDGLARFTVISDSVGVPDEVEGVTEAAGATDVDGVDVCSSGDAGVSSSGDAGDSRSGDTVDGSLSIVVGGSGGNMDEA